MRTVSVGIALLFVVCLAMALAACGGGGGEDEKPTPAAGKIAFASHRDGNPEIHVMNADGSAQTNLTNNPAWDWGAAWSP